MLMSEFGLDHACMAGLDFGDLLCGPAETDMQNVSESIKTFCSWIELIVFR